MKSRFIDLSHPFEDGMPGFRMKDPQGNVITYTVKIRPFLTHEQTKPFYKGLASFEITEMYFQTSIGTYLDSPYHRFPNMRDISQLLLEEVILPGIVIDARDLLPFQPLETIVSTLDLSGKAILFNFGWSKHWGEEQYNQYPFISENIIDYLVAQEVKLVGVDTLNIDDPQNLSRPAHTTFLKNDILIVENLTNLDKLHNKSFRFFAVPLRAKEVAACPIRAFAELKLS
ncbi:MAG: cyclase family protein [Candidatus Heimdallarchaeota archaeon]|nr:MAG: cyclase family protein [Candidatus Heimdallarchaeota archaeon]